MSSAVTIRRATGDDVGRITRFGRDHVVSHYAPILGAAAAESQVEQWWTHQGFAVPLEAGWVLLAEDGEDLVGVAELGRFDGRPVLWKLYVHPDRRGRGIGPQLLRAVVEQVPQDGGPLQLEHFAGNTRAAAFYEREGFTVDRVEPSSTGRPEHDVVWRSRPLGPGCGGARVHDDVGERDR